MENELRSIGGTAYRGTDPIENVFVDRSRRDVVVGQRDSRQRSAGSILLGKICERVNDPGVVGRVNVRQCLGN